MMAYLDHHAVLHEEADWALIQIYGPLESNNNRVDLLGPDYFNILIHREIIRLCLKAGIENGF